jgi:hypothetical protein
MSSQTRAHVEERLDILEKGRRRTNVLTFGLLSVALVAWVAAPQSAPDVVRARSFELVDAEGTLWAELSIREEGPAIALYDGDGTARLSLVHSDEETALYIRDREGDIRVGTAQFAHGGGGFALHGPGGKGAAVLYLKGDGSLTFYDVNGEVTSRVPAR